jgi:hypothetical protein
MRSLDTVIAWVDGSDDEYKRTKGYNFEITETALSISSLVLYKETPSLVTPPFCSSPSI